MPSSRLLGGALLALLVVLAGCQPAVRFKPARAGAAPPAGESGPSKAAGETPTAEFTAAYGDSRALPAPRPDLPIVFVDEETQGDEWRKLPDRLWHDPPLTSPAQLVGLVGLAPLPTGPLAFGGVPQAVRIRVPRGLPSPAALVPASNPPSLRKWRLGRKLFFDRSWLAADGKTACADCHQPGHGFCDDRPGHDGFNSLSLVNCAFNRRQFWDGRVEHLEGVVVRSLEDEREPARPGPFRHAWHGTVERLQKDRAFANEFVDTYGATPSQDGVGKALATYLRTLLAGDALHDRAEASRRRRKAATLEAEDYLNVLDADAVKALGRETYSPRSVAEELYRGYKLFHAGVEGKVTYCARCHAGPTFSDGDFHNLGAGAPFEEPAHAGHFTHVPVGFREPTQVGAFRTPTLRHLSRTGPYLHTGEIGGLAEVIEFHLRGGTPNSYLDPLMVELKERSTRGGPPAFTDTDVEALVLFLRALEGRPIDPVVLPPDFGPR